MCVCTVVLETSERVTHLALDGSFTCLLQVGDPVAAVAGDHEHTTHDVSHALDGSLRVGLEAELVLDARCIGVGRGIGTPSEATEAIVGLGDLSLLDVGQLLVVLVGELPAHE